MKVIEFQNVSKAFSQGFKDQQPVLKDLSFYISKSKITGFLGENGAGKTTSFKALLGLIKIDQGKIFVNGKPLTLDLNSKIGFMPERPSFPEHLNAYEFLAYTKNLYAVDCEEFDSLLLKVGLQKVGKKKIGNFSKGMLQRLSFAQAIMHKPEIVILDEPLSGLDPRGRKEMTHLIQAIHQERVSVFLSSHLIEDIEKMCQDLVIINKGRCVYNGSVKEILSTVAGDTQVVTTEKTQNFSSVIDAKQYIIDAINRNQLLEVKSNKDLSSALTCFESNNE